MKKPWSPLKAALMTVLLILLLGTTGGGVWVAVTDSKASGAKVGGALAPVVLLSGIAAYFIQRSRLADKK